MAAMGMIRANPACPACSRINRTTAVESTGPQSGWAAKWVMPPAAAARVSLAISPVRPLPGRDKCTQASTSPGNTQRPSAWIISAPGASRLAPMRVKRPFSISRSATSSRPLAGSITRPLRIRMWARLRLALAMGTSRCGHVAILTTDGHGHDRHTHGDAERHLVENH